MIKIRLMVETKDRERTVSKKVLVEVVPRVGEKVHIEADDGRIFTVSEVLHSFRGGIPEIDVTMNDAPPEDIEWLKQHAHWK